MEKKLRIFDLERRYESSPITNGASDSNTIPAEAAFEVGPNVHKGTIKAIVWTSDPNVLVTAADDKMIRWWDLRTQEVVQEYQVHGEIGSCEFSNVVTEAGPDIVGSGLPVLTVAAGHAVYFFGGTHARSLLKTLDMGYEVASVALHPSQRKFVTGTKGDTWVKVYSYDTGKEIGMFFAFLPPLKPTDLSRPSQRPPWSSLEYQLLPRRQTLCNRKRGRNH